MRAAWSLFAPRDDARRNNGSRDGDVDMEHTDESGTLEETLQ